MEVKHIQGWTFQVSSQSEPGKTYEIDLSGPPEELCQCGDFYCKHGPAIRNGGEPSAHHCKHIKAIAEHIFWERIFPQAQE